MAGAYLYLLQCIALKYICLVPINDYSNPTALNYAKVSPTRQTTMTIKAILFQVGYDLVDLNHFSVKKTSYDLIMMVQCCDHNGVTMDQDKTWQWTHLSMTNLQQCTTILRWSTINSCQHLTNPSLIITAEDSFLGSRDAFADLDNEWKFIGITKFSKGIWKFNKPPNILEFYFSNDWRVRRTIHYETTEVFY